MEIILLIKFWFEGLSESKVSFSEKKGISSFINSMKKNENMDSPGLDLHPVKEAKDSK